MRTALVALAAIPTMHAAEFKDLIYASTPEKQLALALYLPGGVSKPPLVVWIHGGAWREGTRAKPLALYLVQRGYAVASISYRLTHEAIFPAQIHDCKAAIRWLRAHASKYGYDAIRIGVWGTSAGGHLAALLGTSSGVKELEGDLGHFDQSSAVQAVVDFFGPTDLPQMSKFPGKMDHDAPDSPESQLLGGPVQQNKDKAAVANPITYVTRNDPPFLILHGDKDPLVPLNQSELLDAELNRAGVPVTFRVLSGAGHGGAAFNDRGVQDRVAAFFEQHLDPIAYPGR